MKYSLSDMRTRVRDMLNEDVEAFWLDTNIDDAINEGIRFIAILTSCIQSISSKSTTNADRVVSVGEGYKVSYVEYSGIYLRRILPKSMGHLPKRSSNPTYFFIHDNDIYIDPIPTGANTLSCYVSNQNPTDLTDDDNCSVLPIAFDIGVIYFAVMKCLIMEGNYAAAKSVEALLFSEMGFNETDKVTSTVEDIKSIKDPIIPDKVEAQ